MAYARISSQTLLPTAFKSSSSDMSLALVGPCDTQVQSFQWLANRLLAEIPAEQLKRGLRVACLCYQKSASDNMMVAFL